jgi:hypothetical protein
LYCKHINLTKTTTAAAATTVTQESENISFHKIHTEETIQDDIFNSITYNKIINDHHVSLLDSLNFLP